MNPAREPRPSRPTILLGGALAVILTGISAGACTRDWDAYDPRLGSGGQGASGPSTGTGGASTSTTASNSSAGGTGGATTSSSAGGTGGATTSSSAGGTGGTGGVTTSSSAGGTGGTGGTGGSGGGPIHCGGTNVLADDFPGSDPGEVWNISDYGGATALETGGEAVVTLPSGSPGSSRGAFESNQYYDLTNDHVSIEVTSATNTATTAMAFFSVYYDGNNYIEISQTNGDLRFIRYIAGTWAELKSTLYNAVNHRHWRFREDGTDTHWETSSDGVNWTSQVSEPTAMLFPMNLVGIDFGGQTDGGEVNPGEARFDHLNGGGAPLGKWCPMSSLTDDFEDGIRARIWDSSWEPIPGMMVETGGDLVFTLPPNATPYANYGSAVRFDLTGSSIVIEVPQLADSASKAQTYVDLDAAGDNGFGMLVEGTTLYFDYWVAGTTQGVGSLLYSPVQHKWWRMREAGGTVYWETAPDGKAWTIREQFVPSFPVDALEVSLNCGIWQASANPGASHFDNLNLPPP
jgi:hypothetical protein